MSHINLLMKKILFLAYYYPPLGGGGVQRTIGFIKYLPEHGYCPIVLTGPNVLKSEHHWQPHDDTLNKKVGDNVNVFRIPSKPPDYENTFKRRARRLLSLPDAFSSWWTQQAILKAEQILKEEDIHLIFATMPPYASARIADSLSKKYRIPWMADLRDPWALDEIEGFPSVLHKMAELRRMRNILKTASAIIMNTPEAEKRLKTTFQIFQGKKTVSITNGFDPSDFLSDNNVEAEKKSKFRIVHSGYFYTDLGQIAQSKKKINKVLRGYHPGVDLFTRSPFFLIKALESWISDCPDVLERVEVLFLGRMSESDLKLIRQSDVASRMIQTVGYVTHLENIRYLKSADLLFLAMHDLSNGDRATTVYGKTYEYMRSGTPILAAVPEGDAKEYLNNCGTAFLCKPSDWRRMLDILDHVFNAWQKGQLIVSKDTQFIEQFDRRVLFRKLAAVFEELSI